LTEALISCETVAAALAGIALRYVYLVRRQGVPPTRRAWIVLVLFAGGYCVFAFCMGGLAESYMVLAVLARLFSTGPATNEADAASSPFSMVS
jgi:hypothetical protein